jgi:hypothetical protein
MKKTAIAIALVLLAVSGVFAQFCATGQTYYYKYVQTVDPYTGMSSNDQNINAGWKFNNRYVPDDMYITFTGNTCYTSDYKGISKLYDQITPLNGHLFMNYNTPYYYQGELNNILVFLAYAKESSTAGVYYLYFSKDFKRINFKASLIIDMDGYGEMFKKNIYIYEQADPPKKEEPKPTAPTALLKMW